MRWRGAARGAALGTALWVGACHGPQGGPGLEPPIDDVPGISGSAGVPAGAGSDRTPDNGGPAPTAGVGAPVAGTGVAGAGQAGSESQPPLIDGEGDADAGVEPDAGTPDAASTGG